MRIMGLDYGDKTIGVAMSDEMGWTGQNLEVIKRSSKVKDMARLREIVNEYGVDEIVVGLPKNMDSSIGPRARLCISFAEALKRELNIRVQMYDERLSTLIAQRTLLEADVSRKKRKRAVDKMAAAVILQDYLDSRKRR